MAQPFFLRRPRGDSRPRLLRDAGFFEGVRRNDVARVRKGRRWEGCVVGEGTWLKRRVVGKGTTSVVPIGRENLAAL